MCGILKENITKQQGKNKSQDTQLIKDKDEIDKILAELEEKIDLKEPGGIISLENIQKNKIFLRKKFFRPQCIGYRGFVFGFSPDGQFEVSKFRYLRPQDFDDYN